MAKPAERRSLEAAPIPMVGRQRELQALVRALRARQSRLIVGVTGIGKTRLLEEALSRFPEPCLFLSAPTVLHELLVHLAKGLGCGIDRCSILSKETSITLKGAVFEVLEAEPRPILLEDVEHADPRMHRFLQKLYHLPGNCVIVTARSRHCLGYLRRLLWDPREEIALDPLTHRESAHLFDAASSAYRLRSLDLPEFQRKALESAGGNPGQILAMCRMAARPEYQAGRHIKFLPLRMDMLSAFVR